MYTFPHNIKNKIMCYYGHAHCPKCVISITGLLNHNEQTKQNTLDTQQSTRNKSASHQI